jgi:hypothetical protein
LKFKVIDAPINIDRIQVFYESGDMEEINARHALSKGAESPSFSLKYPGKDIKKVEFTYRTVANTKGEKSELELYGLKTTQPIDDKSYRSNESVNEEAADAREEAVEEREEMKEEAAEAREDLRKESDDAGNEVSEAAAKVMAAIKDKKHADKVGPNGQTIYIDNHGKYYYINNNGDQVFVTEIQLTDKKK